MPITGLTAPDGSMNVTIVSGEVLCGVQAPNGSRNIYLVPQPSLTPVGAYHACGAWNATLTTTPVNTLFAPDGSMYIQQAPYNNGSAVKVTFTTPLWEQPGASLHFDFVQNRAVVGDDNPVTASSLLTVTRNSTSHAPNAAGFYFPFGPNVPRITDLGLLIEESNTNFVRNSAALGATLGSPGTMPTNMVLSTGNGLVRTIVSGPLNTNGMQVMRYQLVGLTTNAGGNAVDFEPANGIPATPGTAYTGTCFFRIISNTTGAFNNVRMTMIERTPDAASDGPIYTPTTGWQRITHSVTNAAGTFIQPRLTINSSAAVNLDITFEVGWPQVETGLYPTSPINTSGTAVTRPADIVNYTLPTGMFQPSTPLSIFAVGTCSMDSTATTPSSYFLSLDALASTERHYLFYNNGGSSLRAAAATAGVAELQMIGARTRGTRVKLAAGFAVNDGAFAINGSPVITDTVGILPTVSPTTLHFGAAYNNTGQLNGFLEEVAIWPNRLSNSKLESLTVITPTWALSPSSISPVIDFDFVNDRSYIKDFPTRNASYYLSTSRFSSAMAEDALGNWSSFGLSVPRITTKGLLTEESRTNSFRNSAAVGSTVGVVGAGGVLPTNWQIAPSPTTIEIVGTGTESGIDYIDLRLAGTTITTEIVFDSVNPASSAGQSWTGSAFVRLIGGSLNNVSYTQLRLLEVGGANPFTNTVFVPTTAPLTTQRSTVTRLFTDGVATAARMRMPFASTGTFDMTLRIGWPQLELGAFATSPIRTTGATATRAAESVRLLPLPPAATGMTAVTLYSAGTSAQAVGGVNGNHIFSLTDGTNNERIEVLRTITDTAVGSSVNLAGGNFGTSAGSWVQNQRGKIAFATASADKSASFNGAPVVTGTTAQPLPPNIACFGGRSSGDRPFNGYVERATVWNSRLSNADIQTLTT